MKHASIRIILLVILLVALYLFIVNKDSEEEEVIPMEDEVVMEVSLMNEEVSDLMEEVTPEERQLFEGDFFNIPFTYSGSLEDVTGGEASGFAQAGFKEELSETQSGMYLLEVRLENLPELTENFFYEGWLVRRSPFVFISTGTLAKHTDGGDMNRFVSLKDYTPYDFYVLTLEPDDGDPAPAEHILEGELFPSSSF